VAVCGLGAGALSSYAQPGQHWTFYEIDAVVVRVAENPALFTYLEQAFPDQSLRTIELGDARLRLSHAADGEFGLIVIDVFSSDAVPVHLIDREAVQLYLRKLAPGGLLLFHVSNRYLDLKRVLAPLAADAGLTARACDDIVTTDADSRAGKDASIWVVMARTKADLGPLAQSFRWFPLDRQPGAPVWTDDFSNLWGALRWGPME
jgi:hypothetical protein